MKAYDYCSGSITPGFGLSADVDGQGPKVGPHLFIGEFGRGREFEKLALDKFAQPSVVDGRILDCAVRKVEPKGSKRAFFVLTRDDSRAAGLLVRINTRGVYTRGCAGFWRAHRGNPTAIVSAYGAHGDAGRLPGWSDSVVRMTEGDVLFVETEGGSKTANFAIFVEGGEPKAMELSIWKAYDAAQVARTNGVEPVFGAMHFFSYLGRGVDLLDGVRSSTSAAGPAIVLGESGRGRSTAIIPLVGFEGENVCRAAIGQSGERYFITSADGADEEVNTFAIRLCVAGAQRAYYNSEAVLGTPSDIGSGKRASGIAGRAGSSSDSLWVLRQGDAVRIGPKVIENVSGKPSLIGWQHWRLKIVLTDPGYFVGNNLAPWGAVPQEWIGKVGKVLCENGKTQSGDIALQDGLTGVLLSVSPLTLDVGYKTGDAVEREVRSGLWIELLPHESARTLSEDERTAREEKKARARSLLAEISESMETEWFALLPHRIQQRAQYAFGDGALESLPLKSDWDLDGLSERAESLLAEIRAQLEAVRKIEQEIGAEPGSFKLGAEDVGTIEESIEPEEQVQPDSNGNDDESVDNTPLDITKVDLSRLFGGSVKVERDRRSGRR